MPCHVTSAGRSDAEYFQPQYERLRKHLKKRGANSLGELWIVCEKGTQPDAYSDDGKVVVVKSKNVFGIGLDLAGCERTGLSAWEDVSARVSKGDLVVNSTGRG